MKTVSALNTHLTPLSIAIDRVCGATNAGRAIHGRMRHSRKANVTAGMGAAMLLACGHVEAATWSTEIDRVDGVVISADWDGSGDESIAFVVGTDYPNSGDPTAWSTAEIFPTYMAVYNNFQVDGNTTLGNASSDSTNINGSLSVSNGSTLNGTTNITGNIQNNSGDLTLNDTVNITGSVYNSSGTFTINDSASVTGTLGVTGATTLNGASTINNTLSVDSNGATAGGNTLQVNNTSASMLNSNSQGLTVGANSTTLSGSISGLSSTSVALDTFGASITNSTSGELMYMSSFGQMTIGDVDGGLAGSLVLMDDYGGATMTLDGSTGNVIIGGDLSMGGDLWMANSTISDVSQLTASTDMRFTAGTDNDEYGGNIYLEAFNHGGSNGNIFINADVAYGGIVSISAVDTNISNNLNVGAALDVAGNATIGGVGATNHSLTAGTNTLVINDTTGMSLDGNGATSKLDGTSATLLNSTNHGLTVGATSTTLSGGTSTTSMTLDDAGVSFVDDGYGGIFAVNTGGAASIGRADLAGSLGISDGAGSNGVTFNGATGEGYFAGHVEVGGNLDMTNGNIENVVGVYSVDDMVIHVGDTASGGDLFVRAHGGTGSNGDINLIADAAYGGVVNISSGSHGITVDATNGIAAIGTTNTMTASASNTIRTTGGGSLTTTTTGATLAMTGGGTVATTVGGTAVTGTTNTNTATVSNTLSVTGGGSVTTTVGGTAVTGATNTNTATVSNTLSVSGGGSVQATVGGVAINGTTNTITGTTNTITGTTNTVTGTTNINTTGIAATTIGNTTGNVGITGAAVTINTANTAGLTTTLGSTNAGAGNVHLQAGGLNAMTISTAAGTAVAGAFSVDSNGATANAAGTGTLSVADNGASMGVVQGGNVSTGTASASIQGYNAAGFATNGTAGNTSNVGAGGLTVYNSVQTVTANSTINNMLEGRQYSNMVNGNLFVDGNVYINGTLDYVSANSASTTVIGSSGSSKLAGATQGTSGGTNIIMKDVNGAAESSASLTLTNGYGNTHGVQVYEDRTILSGGTTSTTMTLDDSGATFRNTDTGGGPARVTGVADGKHRYDAVNFGQLEKAYEGVATVAALAMLPDPMPGKKHSLGMGYGNFESRDAVAFGYRGDLTDTVRVTAGVSLSGGETTTGVGVGFSW